MGKTRLEAFSDGVIAILITIMVLELKVPHGDRFADLQPMVPILCSYLLSFVFIGIYWNNHHHMLHATERINGAILWANLHLLFWLSLVPFGTAWVGESSFGAVPLAVYGAILLGSGFAYLLLQILIIREEGPDSRLARAVGADRKGKFSALLYASAIPLSFLNRWIAAGIYVAVSAMWLIPDRRIERSLGHGHAPQ